MKFKFMNQILAAFLALQLTGLPGAAVLATESGDITDQEITESLIDSFEDAEDAGWRFLNADKEVVNMAELVEGALDDGEFYAVSPEVESLDAALSTKLKIDNATENGFDFEMEVLNEELDTVISERKITFDIRAENAERTKLAFARMMRSMTDEINFKKDQLASLSFGDHLRKGLKSIGEFFIPSAFAGMEETSSMLKKVAGGACTLGIVMLLFADTTVDKKLTMWGWFTILAFVVGGALFIGSGLVADLELGSSSSSSSNNDEDEGPDTAPDPQ